MAGKSVDLELPAKIARVLTEPNKRYRVLYGGRGGAKSWGVARVLLALALSKKIRVLCARELQNSIADSVHYLLKTQIETLGLDDAFEVLVSEIRCLQTGSEFFFTGLRNAGSKIKSFEAIDIVWVEEAQTVSESSWAVLIPTIRKPGSEIWVTFNPGEDTDPTYKRFVKQTPPDTAIEKVCWDDNPWLPDPLRREKDYLYSIDPDAAAHVWGGETRRLSAAQVLNGKWVVAPFAPADHWFGPYYGADWGFAQSPTVLVKVWVDEVLGGLGRDLYLEAEAYGHGVDISATPALFDQIPGAAEHTIRSDCSRPETISHMCQHGYPGTIACDKGPGSVIDGIQHLRGYRQIVIHPRCIHAAEQARLYSWKTDPLTGDVLPVLVKKHDDVWDAVRYALEPLMGYTDQIIAPQDPTGPSELAGVM